MSYDAFSRMTMGKLLAFQANERPEQVCLQLGDSRWTYAETEEQSTMAAKGLLGLGLRPGDRLAVSLPNVPGYVLALFAAAKAGLVLVPINVRRHQTEVATRLAKARPAAWIAFSDPDEFEGIDHLAMAQALRSELSDLKYVVSFAGGDGGTVSWPGLLEGANDLSLPTVEPDDPAAIVYTLGSLGQPRGAILRHGGLVRNAAAVAAGLACTSADVFLGAVPFSNAFGLTPTILACMVAGAKLVCLPRYRAGAALRLIKERGVTVHHGVPTMFLMELNHREFRAEECAGLRAGIMSGAPCSPDLVKRVRKEMGFNLQLAYGLTEASPSVSITRADDGPVTAVETVGRPHEGIALKVIDREGVELPAGEEGELCVRGYNVMAGYWDDGEATERAVDKDGWLHTGDLATIDPDGPVRIVGRKDEVIHRGGFKVHPGSVEMVLRSYPGVKEAAVVGIPDLVYGELSCACVVRRGGADFTAEALSAFVAERLADYARPDRVLFFDALPRRGGGPVRKRYLQERVRIHGRAWKFGKNIDTDAIIPARRCNSADPGELAQYCMEDADPEFIKKMSRGDLIVAGSNFGCGSSREVAPLSIKAAGISAVIADSFARIFFRNSINIGLPILECPEAVERIREGDKIEVEPATGTIRNLTRRQVYQAEPFPGFLQNIIDLGGLPAYVENRLAQEQA